MADATNYVQQMAEQNRLAAQQYAPVTTTSGPLMLLGVGAVVLVAVIGFMRRKKRGKRKSR